MIADTWTEEVYTAGNCDPGVAIREDDGTVVIWIMQRWEYKETMEEVVARANRIARFLTHNGTKQGKRDDQD